MNSNFKRLTQKLDLCGVVERVEKREQAREEEQQAQQVASDSRAAVERGMRSFLNESDRRINVERLKRDPLLAFFILANRSPDSV